MKVIMMRFGYNQPFFDGGGGWLMMGAGMVLQLVFWGLIIYVIIRLLNGAKVGGLFGKKGDDAASQSPEDIVKQRFARGEITKEQYKEMIGVLKE